MKITPSIFFNPTCAGSCLALALSLLGCEPQSTSHSGVTQEEPASISSREQALNSLVVYQDPSSSQSIVQPAGTVLSLQGTVDLSSPRSLAGVKYADQFAGADMGAKINAAIAALGANGGTVVVPNGSWTFATGIVLDDRRSIVLRGLGAPTGGAAAATNLIYNGPCGRVISARSSGGVHITGLSLSTTTSCSGTPMYLIDFSHGTTNACPASAPTQPCDAALGVVEGCNLIGPVGTVAVNLNEAIEMTVRGNNIASVDIGIQGRSLTKYSNSVRIENNQFYAIRSMPIKNGGQAWLVQGNTFEQLAVSGSAGAFSHDPGVGAEGITFSANWFGDATATGTWIDWIGRGLVVQGNYFGNAATSVRVGGSSVNISGNTFASTGGATVDLSSAGESVTVSANVFDGMTPIARSTTVPMSRASITANTGTGLAEYVAEAVPTINVRTIVTKSIANGLCPAGSSAIYAPRSYVGLTGTAICAANTQTSRSCVTEKFVYVTSDNHYGVYPSSDRACSERVTFPWPWGYDYDKPSTLDGEWSHGDTWIVCCQ